MSITLQWQFLLDQVLTDADTDTVVLSDPTGTYGVKRDDNDAVVVAAGTAMTRTATGTYEVTFTEPAAGLDYTYYVEYDYDGTTYHSAGSYSDATQVVSVSDMKTHLRIDFTDDDAYLYSLIDAVTAQCQDYQRRKYLTTTITEYLDTWPRSGVIEPKWGPLVAVTSITYVDSEGSSQTWSSDEYDVDNDSFIGRIKPAYGYTFPSLRSQMQAVTLTYSAGYGTAAADTPDNIRWAIRLWVHALYHARGSFEAAQMGIPQAVKAMLAMQEVVSV